VIFFSRYTHYIQIDISADTEEKLRTWYGWVESRLRFLILRLENTLNMSFAHPYPQLFTNNDPIPPPDLPVNNGPTHAKYCFSAFLGLSFSDIAKKGTVDLTPAVNEFQYQIDDWPRREPGMYLYIRHLLRFFEYNNNNNNNIQQ